MLTGALPAAIDADNDPVAYTVGTQALNGTVLIATDGSYQYTPNTGFVGTDSFSYIVDDGNGGTNEYDIVVTVIPAIPLPAAHPDTNPTDPVIEAGFDQATGAPVGDATTSGNALDNDTGQGLAVVGVVAGLASGAQSGGVGTESTAPSARSRSAPTGNGPMRSTTGEPRPRRWPPARWPMTCSATPSSTRTAPPRPRP